MLEQTAIHAEQRVQSSPDSINAGVIQACQEGDREAFRLLFEAYKDRVFSIACYSLGDEAAADDITQTPSKFWPEGYELLFGIPASVLVFFLLWKFAGPAVKKGMAARTAKIQAELDSGEAEGRLDRLIHVSNA